MIHCPGILNSQFPCHKVILTNQHLFVNCGEPTPSPTSEIFVLLCGRLIDSPCGSAGDGCGEQVTGGGVVGVCNEIIAPRRFEGAIRHAPPA